MSHFHTTPEGMRRGREPEPGTASRQTPNGSCTHWLDSSLLPAEREPEENHLTARSSCPPPSCRSLPVPRLNQKAAPLHPVMQSGELLIEEWPEGLDGQMDTVQHTFISALMSVTIGFEFLQCQI